MRQGDHVGPLVEQRRREVADVAPQLVVLEGCDQRGFVDDRTAREIEEDRRLLHGLELFGADQATGAIDEGDVDGDDVGALEHLLQRRDVLDRTRERPGVLDGDRRVVAEDAHTERHGYVGDLHTDGPQPDDAEGAPRQLEADVRLLPGLDELVHGGVVALEAVGERCGVHDVAGGEEDAGDDELLHRVGVGAGRVEHRDAALRQLVDRNVVRAGACTSHGEDAGRDRFPVELGGAHEEGVRIGHVMAHLVAVAGQPGETDRADGVEGTDAKRHLVFWRAAQPWVRSNSFMNSMRASTPSGGMAL